MLGLMYLVYISPSIQCIVKYIQYTASFVYLTQILVEYATITMQPNLLIFLAKFITFLPLKATCTINWYFVKMLYTIVSDLWIFLFL